jgi:hypothetical protein
MIRINNLHSPSIEHSDDGRTGTSIAKGDYVHSHGYQVIWVKLH